jgi:mono/diheme cytochrome c family protein
LPHARLIQVKAGLSPESRDGVLTGGKNVLKTIMLTGAVLFVGAAPAWSEGSGDAFRGKAYAQAMCGSCHSISADDTASANPAAKPFKLARLDNKTGEEFSNWMNTKHPPIQSLINPRQADDILTYVGTLKSAEPK